MRCWAARPPTTWWAAARPSSDTFYGNGGTDYVYGNGGNVTLCGAGGTEFLSGGSGFNTLIGRRTRMGRQQRLQRIRRRHRVNGGTDLFYGGVGTNLMYEGSGTDVFAGNAGTDFIFGGTGRPSSMAAAARMWSPPGRATNISRRASARPIFNDTAANLTAGRFDQIDNFKGAQSDGTGTFIYLPTQNAGNTSFVNTNGGTAIITPATASVSGQSEIFVSGVSAGLVASSDAFHALIPPGQPARFDNRPRRPR